MPETRTYAHRKALEATYIGTDDIARRRAESREAEAKWAEAMARYRASKRRVKRGKSRRQA